MQPTAGNGSTYVLLSVRWFTREKLGDLGDTSSVDRAISRFLLAVHPSTRWTRTSAIENGWYHWLREFCDADVRDVLTAIQEGKEGAAMVTAQGLSPECLQGNRYLLLYHALRCESLTFFHWYTRNFVPDWEAIRAVVETKHLDGLQWFLSEDRSVGPFISNVIRTTPERHRLLVLDMFNEVASRPWTNVLDDAAALGDFEVVKWLDSHRPEECSTAAMDEAAGRGDLAMLQYLHVHRNEGCSRNAMDNAAANGRLHVVQWLHEHRAEGCTTAALDTAASNGHLEVVKWLHENREEGCTKIAMDWAAAHGHLEVVQWLDLNRTEGCTQIAMNWAASRGYKHILEWLHENRTEGCSETAMDEAASQGRWDIVSWLVEHQPEPSLFAMNQDAAHHGWGIKRWSLVASDTEARVVAKRAATYGMLNVIKWLHRNRPTVFTANVMDLAAQNNHLDIVRFLHKNRQEGCTFAGLVGAINSRHVNLVEFLYESRLELALWPRPQDASRVVALFSSDNEDDQAILRVVATRRNIRYRAISADITEQISVHAILRSNEPFTWAVVEVLGFPDAISVLISEFLAATNNAWRWNEKDAAQRGWIHWISSFGHLEHRHLLWAAHAGNFEAVTSFHELLAREDRLECNREFLEISLAKGDAGFFQWHAEHCAQVTVPDHVYLATWAGRLDVLESIKTLRSRRSDSELRPSGIGVDETKGAEELEEAAAHGDLHHLQMLVRSGDSVFTPRVLDIAARNGHLEVVQWLIETCNLMGTTVGTEYLTFLPTRWEEEPLQIQYTQMSNSLLAQVELVQSQACTPMELAVRHGHIDIVKYLHSQWSRSTLKCCTTNAVDFAATYGHLDILEFLVEHRKEGGTIAGFYGAIRNRYVEVVRYLYRHYEYCRQWPLPRDGSDVLQSLMEQFFVDFQQVKIDEDLRRLIHFFRTERNMRFPPQTMDLAIFCGDERKAVVIQELDIGSCTTLAMDIAATKGDMAAVGFLHTNRTEGCTHRAMDGAAEEGHLSVVKFLHEMRSEGCSRSAIDLAAKNGHTEVVKYLLKHRSEGYSPYALFWATLFGHDEIVRLLMEDCDNPGDVAHCLDVAQTRGFETIENCLRDGLQAYVESKPRTQWSQARRRRQKRLQSFLDLDYPPPPPPRVVHDELALAIDPSGAAQSNKAFRQLYPHVNQFLPLSDSRASPRNSLEMFDSDDDDDGQSFDSTEWYNYSDGVNEETDLIVTTWIPSQTSELILGDSFEMDETFYQRLPPSPKNVRSSLWCPCGVSFWGWCRAKLHNIGQ